MLVATVKAFRISSCSLRRFWLVDALPVQFKVPAGNTGNPLQVIDPAQKSDIIQKYTKSKIVYAVCFKNVSGPWLQCEARAYPLKSDQRRDDRCAGGLRKHARRLAGAIG
jgi:hypothetical protein